MAEQIRRAGRMRRAHKPATRRSEVRRWGDRSPPPLPTSPNHRRALNSLQFGLLMRVQVMLGLLPQDVAHPLLR